MKLKPTFAVVCLMMLAPQVIAQTSFERNAGRHCENLRTEDFSRLADAPSQVIGSRLIGGVAERFPYCEVSGYVTPNVDFLLRMPPHRWNGKLMQLGCGGHCGSTEHVRQCDDPVRRGYACIVTDGGHTSTGAQALWAHNNWQSQIDYFVRAAHVTALAGKAIVERYYGRAPSRSYFMGCSAGGREAMMQAQRFPQDFDGIIAGAPSLNQPAIRMNVLWGIRAFNGADGCPLLKSDNIDVLHRAVVAKCDLNDGLKDGLIGDPRRCAFDPAELLCGSARQDACLTSEQVAAVEKIYGGPVTSTGAQIQLPGALRGSERTWSDWFGSGIQDFVEEAFRYYAFDMSPGVDWQAKEFDFDRDPHRLGIAIGLYSAVNPDLRAFKAAGGKLLSYIGWNDAGGMPLPVIDYYETAERVAGGRTSTRDFYRLFVVPGMNHCTGGDGPFAADWLSVLEAWVEKAHAPDEVMAFHIAPPASDHTGVPQFPLSPATIDFSRPLYPYPILTQYRGSGSPKDAGSFTPVNPE